MIPLTLSNLFEIMRTSRFHRRSGLNSFPSDTIQTEDVSRVPYQSLQLISKCPLGVEEDLPILLVKVKELELALGNMLELALELEQHIRILLIEHRMVQSHYRH